MKETIWQLRVKLQVAVSEIATNNANTLLVDGITGGLSCTVNQGFASSSDYIWSQNGLIILSDDDSCTHCSTRLPFASFSEMVQETPARTSRLTQDASSFCSSCFASDSFASESFASESFACHSLLVLSPKKLHFQNFAPVPIFSAPFVASNICSAF